MKNVIVRTVILVGFVVIALWLGFSSGKSMGYENGYREGIEVGVSQEKEAMKDWAYDNVNRTGRYYGYDGITVEFMVTEGNINNL